MKICPSCGEWFEPSRSHHWQKYCNKECSQAARYKRKLAQGLKGRTFDDMKREKMRGDL